MTEITSEESARQYDEIIDWMIKHPHKPLHEYAAELNKEPFIITRIVNSSAFKAHFTRRKTEVMQRHCESILAKMIHIAELSLGLILDRLEIKGDEIPLRQLQGVAEFSLDRLGYGVNKERRAVQINLGGNANTRQVLQVPRTALMGARARLRAAEERKDVDLKKVEAGGDQPGLEAVLGDLAQPSGRKPF